MTLSSRGPYTAVAPFTYRSLPSAFLNDSNYNYKEDPTIKEGNIVRKRYPEGIKGEPLPEKIPWEGEFTLRSDP